MAIGDDNSRTAVDRWFAEQVLPLEAELMRFLRRSWRNEAELADLRQETMVRAYESGARQRPQHTRPFVYMIARNLMADRIRRARVVAIDYIEDLDGLNVSAQEPLADQQLSAREDLRRFVDALARLPARCREVIVLRKVDGLSQREVAQRMGITEDTVERQVSKGMRLLADAMAQGSELPAGDTLPDWLRNSRWRRQ